MRLSWVIIWWSCLTLIAGCTGGGSSVTPPDIDPAAAAKAAIAQYDHNSDSALSAEEVENSALSLEKWDADGNGSLSAGEIEQRLTFYVEYGTGMSGLSCSVRFKGRPLQNAKVTLTPEELLGDALHPSFGTTGPDGIATLSVAPEFRPRPEIEAVQIGLYKVEITHPDVEIQSVTPSAYELAPGEEVINPTFEVK